MKRKRRGRRGGLSKRPEARARQLANLRAGSVEAGTAAGPGNTRSLQHGAYRAISREQLEGKTREVFDALSLDVPLKDRGELPAPDALPVRLLAETLIRLESIGAFLNRKGWEDSDGRVRPVVEIEMRLRNQALDLAESLGCTPRSRARLGLDLRRQEAFDLAAHWAESEDGSIEGEAEEEGE